MTKNPAIHVFKYLIPSDRIECASLFTNRHVQTKDCSSMRALLYAKLHGGTFLTSTGKGRKQNTPLRPSLVFYAL